MSGSEPRVVTPGFHSRVYTIVQQIPRGSVSTYGDVATLLGSPQVARHVGWALAGLTSEKEVDVPWHRVINAQGRISHRGDVGRAREQLERLADEGVCFDSNGRCALEKYRWRPEGSPQV